MRMTEHEFAVCTQILRAEEGPLLSACRLVLVGLRSSSYALHEYPSLSKQQLSNALSRYEAKHKLILTGYDQKPEVEPEGAFWV